MKANLQKIGNSTGAIIPAHILKKHNLKVGVQIEIEEEGDRIIIKPVQDDYSLKELLALCTKENMSFSDEDKRWLNATPRGNELL